MTTTTYRPLSNEEIIAVGQINYDYSYGDSVTTVSVPLENRYPYTKGQQALIDVALSHGWTLDITALKNSYGWRFAQLSAERRLGFLSQHPFTFVRPAIDALGGHWQIELDYVSREYTTHGSRGFNKTLKGAKLIRVQADGTETLFPAKLSGYATRSANNDNTQLVLEPTGTAGYSANNWVWDAASVGEERLNLRERVEELLADPEGVISRAVQQLAAHEVAEAERQAKRKAIEEARRRPLSAAWVDLRDVAAQVAKADGLSDTAALLATLKAAVALVEGEVVVA
jgi:hypothetical protein